MPPIRARIPSLLLALGLGWTVTAPAFGQARSVGEEMARRRLIESAQAAHKAGDHGKALELANRAAEIQMTPSLRWFLAFEQQEFGRVAEAFGNAEQCATEFERDPSLPRHAEYLRLCRELRDGLRSRVGYLILKPTSQPPGMVVRIAGQEVKWAVLGLPFLVTPGSITVEASAPGHVPFRTEIDVPAGPGIEATIKLAAAAPPTQPAARPASPPPRPASPPPSTPASPKPSAPASPKPSALTATTPPLTPARVDAGRTPVAAYLTGAVGLVGLASGVTFGVMTRMRYDDLAVKYDADKEASGKRLNVMQAAGYTVGLLGLGAAVTIALIGRSQREGGRADNNSLTLAEVGLVSNGARVGWRF